MCNNIFKHLRQEPYGKVGFDFLNIYELYSNEFRARKDSMDETLMQGILVDKCYDPNMWFNRNLREVFVFDDVKCIIDAGANIGVASCYFANLFKNATVHAFEVESDNYELLKINTTKYENIITYNTAIWENDKGVYIENRNNIYGHSGKANPAKFVVNNKFIESEEKINSICLSDFMELNGIDDVDILKMDIQGAEIEAFSDSEKWLPKVRLLFIETHDLFRKGCSTKVFEKITRYGNFVFVGSPNGEILAFLRRTEL